MSLNDLDSKQGMEHPSGSERFDQLKSEIAKIDTDGVLKGLPVEGLKVELTAFAEMVRDGKLVKESDIQEALKNISWEYLKKVLDARSSEGANSNVNFGKALWNLKKQFNRIGKIMGIHVALDSELDKLEKALPDADAVGIVNQRFAAFYLEAVEEVGYEPNDVFASLYKKFKTHHLGIYFFLEDAKEVARRTEVVETLLKEKVRAALELDAKKAIKDYFDRYASSVNVEGKTVGTLASEMAWELREWKKTAAKNGPFAFYYPSDTNTDIALKGHYNDLYRSFLYLISENKNWDLPRSSDYVTRLVEMTKKEASSPGNFEGFEYSLQPGVAAPFPPTETLPDSPSAIQKERSRSLIEAGEGSGVFPGLAGSASDEVAAAVSGQDAPDRESPISIRTGAAKVRTSETTSERTQHFSAIAKPIAATAGPHNPPTSQPESPTAIYVTNVKPAPSQPKQRVEASVIIRSDPKEATQPSKHMQARLEQERAAAAKQEAEKQAAALKEAERIAAAQKKAAQPKKGGFWKTVAKGVFAVAAAVGLYYGVSKLATDNKDTSSEVAKAPDNLGTPSSAVQNLAPAPSASAQVQSVASAAAAPAAVQVPAAPKVASAPETAPKVASVLQSESFQLGASKVGAPFTGKADGVQAGVDETGYSRGDKGASFYTEDQQAAEALLNIYHSHPERFEPSTRETIQSHEARLAIMATLKTHAAFRSFELANPGILDGKNGELNLVLGFKRDAKELGGIKAIAEGNQRIGITIGTHTIVSNPAAAAKERFAQAVLFEANPGTSANPVHVDDKGDTNQDKDAPKKELQQKGAQPDAGSSDDGGVHGFNQVPVQNQQFGLNDSTPSKVAEAAFAPEVRARDAQHAADMSDAEYIHREAEAFAKWDQQPWYKKAWRGVKSIFVDLDSASVSEINAELAELDRKSIEELRPEIELTESDFIEVQPAVAPKSPKAPTMKVAAAAVRKVYPGSSKNVSMAFAEQRKAKIAREKAQIEAKKVEEAQLAKMAADVDNGWDTIDQDQELEKIDNAWDPIAAQHEKVAAKKAASLNELHAKMAILKERTKQMEAERAHDNEFQLQNETRSKIIAAVQETKAAA